MSLRKRVSWKVGMEATPRSTAAWGRGDGQDAGVWQDKRSGKTGPVGAGNVAEKVVGEGKSGCDRKVCRQAAKAMEVLVWCWSLLARKPARPIGVQRKRPSRGFEVRRQAGLSQGRVEGTVGGALKEESRARVWKKGCAA
jgi:hypothetical protein